MDMDMDMDVDIDLGPEPDAIELEAMKMDPPTEPNEHAPEDTIIPEAEQGEIEQELSQEKIHLRGLDNLTTDDIRTFAAENSSEPFARVEWIDDGSANLVYDTHELAYRAFASFELDPISTSSSDPLELRKAKPLSTHPGTQLFLRWAVATDAKKPGARHASRFYLLNPEHDPAERRRAHDGRRGGRDSYRSRPRQHRRDEDDVPFDVNMYDDDPDSLAAQREFRRQQGRPRLRNSSEGDRSRDTRLSGRRNDDLFANRAGRGSDGRLRDRSASPLRDGDGRHGFDEDAPGKRIAHSGLSLKDRINRPLTNGNSGKELFDSDNDPQSALRANGHKSPPKELFPRASNHRRTGALSVGKGELAVDRIMDGSPESRPIGRSLVDRITGGPSTDGARSASRSLADRIQYSESVGGLRIRGTSATTELSIKGASKLGVDHPRVKELFPDRTNNEGRELFDGRIKGRAGARRKAEDMFF